MPAEAYFGRFWADSGPPFGPIFGTFRHFLGGRNFDRKMIEIRGLIRRGRRQGVGLRKLILSLQTPNHPFVSEGSAKKFCQLHTPKGCGEFKGLRLCHRPLFFHCYCHCSERGGVGGRGIRLSPT